jgi:hypothetical protein
MLSKDSVDARRHFLAALLFLILTGLGLALEVEDVIIVADIGPEEDAAVTVLFLWRYIRCIISIVRNGGSCLWFFV